MGHRPKWLYKVVWGGRGVSGRGRGEGMGERGGSWLKFLAENGPRAGWAGVSTGEEK